MNHTLLASTLAIALALTASSAFAERKKMELLSPAEGPCLYLLDDQGNETSTVANAPCDANGTIVNPGDPAAMPQPAKATPASGNRDAASGLPTGKRQHKPISVD